MLLLRQFGLYRKRDFPLNKHYEKPQVTAISAVCFETVCAGSGQTGTCEYGNYNQGSPKPDIGGVCEQPFSPKATAPPDTAIRNDGIFGYGCGGAVGYPKGAEHDAAI